MNLSPVGRREAMSYIDLQNTLSDWPYEPDKISVRKILGTDGAVRVQMRVELGIIQMNAEGRPDGKRPFGCESLLSYYRKRQSKHHEANGTLLGFALTPQECHMLRLEASLYYRRYVAYFVLEEFDAVIADTTHSLELFDLCRDFSLEPEDRNSLEEFRPYVLMMHARAQAYAAMQEGEAASALAHVNRGIMAIATHYDNNGGYESGERGDELKILRDLGRELSHRVPKDSILVTRKALRDAIEQERFEEAARLRDDLEKIYPSKNVPPNAA